MNKTKIWLLVDEQELIDFFEETIRPMEGIELTIFNGIEDFLTELLGTKKPDMIFLDGNLDNSNLSSTDLIQKIREQDGKDILIYALTNSPRIEKEMEDAGANGYFRKDDANLIEEFLGKII